MMKRFPFDQVFWKHSRRIAYSIIQDELEWNYLNAIRCFDFFFSQKYFLEKLLIFFPRLIFLLHKIFEISKEKFSEKKCQIFPSHTNLKKILPKIFSLIFWKFFAFFLSKNFLHSKSLSFTLELSKEISSFFPFPYQKKLGSLSEIR